jgi:predicted RNA binding protein YcfA (HicA-like mRNA interferase family)
LPKLPVTSGPKAIRALRKAGFYVDHQVGSHVTMVHTESGREVVVPHHGERDLKPGTLRAIIRDAGLTVDEFRRLLK